MPVKTLPSLAIGKNVWFINYLISQSLYWNKNLIPFQGYNKMLEKMNFKRDKIVDIQKALKSADINQDNRLDFEEWRKDLKRWVVICQTHLTFDKIYFDDFDVIMIM